jgi:4-amino-4-deoxy-L-arabinose transferase-like glycosyltransferase
LEERNLLALGIILVLGFLVFFLGLASAPLLDPDEARLARTSVEMMRSHDFVVPTFEGEPRLVKPPLLHWIQSSLFRIFGPSELVARLPAAVSAFFSLLLVAWIGWRRFGDEGAAWAATFFATMPLVVATGRIGTLDALLSVHVLAVIALDLTQPDRTGLQKSTVMGALLGLAFLVKGPVGVVLPLVMMLAGRTACGRDVLPSLRTIVTAALAWSVVVLPWGLVFIQRVGGEAAAGTVRTEALARYFAGTAHVEPWWFYGKVLLVVFLPWGIPLVAGIVRGLARWREPDSPTGPYAAAAFTAGLVFFSLGKGKLANYLVPLAPLAALVIAFELGQELVNPTKRRLAPGLVAATLVAVAVILGAGGVLRLEGLARAGVIAGSVVYGLGALVALYAITESRPRLVYGAGAAASLLFLLLLIVAVPPIIGATRSARPLIEAVPQLASSRPLVLVDRHLPSLTYYLDRVPEKIHGRELALRLDRGDAPLVVITDRDFDALPAEVRGRLRRLGNVEKLSVYEPNSPSP